MFNNQNLRTKLLAILIIFALVPICIAGTANVTMNLWSMKNATFQSNMNTAQQVANQIKVLLDDSRGITELMANDPTVKSLNAGNIKEMILAAQKSNPQFELIYVMDKTGMQLARTSGTLANRADRDYFKEAAKGKIYVTDTYISSFTNAPTVTMSAPVRDMSGEVVGVVATDISLTALANIAQQVVVGQTGYLDIVDSKGVVLAHPDQEKVLNKESFAAYDYVNKAINGQSGSSETVSTRGDKALTVFTTVAGYNWGVIVHEPVAEVYQTVLKTGVINIVIMLLFLVLAIVTALYIVKGIVVPINRLIEAAAKVAGGDLSHNITVVGVREVNMLAEKFNEMLNSLRALATNSLQASDSIAASSHELAGSTEELGKASQELAQNISEVADGATNQVQLADKTTRVIGEMIQSIEEATRVANEVVQTSRQSETAAGKGTEQIELAVKSMSSIQQDVGLVDQMIHSLGDKSHQIGQIVEVITGIAGQTNLLALNAAIEAARAGEQGRGFAVVAEEVRKLAEQSESAAKEITEIIGAIQTETEKAVQAMDKGSQEVREGADIVTSSGEVFQAIFTAVQKMRQGIENIAQVSQQQRAHSDAVKETVQGIVKSVQSTASNSQQIAAASEEQNAGVEEITAATATLAKMSTDLKTAVNKFKIE